MPTMVTFKGNPLTLVGRRIKENTPAPDFKVLSGELKEVRLADFKAKLKVITTFPSSDTPVCDLQLKAFNTHAAGFSSDVVVLGISKDLPFAQKRFCELNGIEKVTVLSDYKYSSFGLNYGLLIKELNLLARTVLIVDKNDFIRYIQIVPEITNQPDYRHALSALGEIIRQGPGLAAAGAAAAKCKPCEGGIAALPKSTIDKLLAQHRGWELVEDKKITKTFTHKDFADAKYFLDMVSAISEEQGHHPTMTLAYNKVKITLSTHAAGGLTDNDFIMARLIDELGGSE
ncbi:MAG TPA: thiol peroxidase [Patescibacteria group bacterium]|nr:thiol peroxidase [Patescibacteria group bacterium]